MNFVSHHAESVNFSGHYFFLSIFWFSPFIHIKNIQNQVQFVMVQFLKKVRSYLKKWEYFGFNNAMAIQRSIDQLRGHP